MGIQTVSQALDNEGRGSPYGFKNRIINGAMNIWQRGTSASNVTTTSNFFVADRFCHNRNSDVTGGNVDRVTDVPTGFTYALKISRASGNSLTGGLYLFYNFESKDILDLKGKQVTLSFWAKAGANYTGGSATAVLSYGTGTDQKVYEQTSPSYAINQSLSLTTTWKRFTYTGTLGSNMGCLGFFVYSGAHSGTAGADDSMYFTGFQLEPGPVATSFDYRPYGTELALCQRYYAKTFIQSVAPAQNADNVAFAGITSTVSNATSSYVAAVWTFPTTMRVVPTITTYNPAAGNANFRNNSNNADYTVTYVAHVSDTKVTIGTGASVPTGGYGIIHVTGVAEL